MAIGDKIIKTAFTAKDKITKTFGFMTRAAARFGTKAFKSFRKASRGASQFNKITTGFLKAQVIGKGVGLLTQGIGSVVTQFIAFDKAALGATVRFKDIGPEAANFNEQLKLIEKSARDMGATTEFTSAQSAEALDFLARAGFTSTEAMGSLKSMIDLATASGEDFAQVADMSSDLLGAFGLNVSDTSQKIANLNRLNDVLVKSANSANVTIETMFETMKTAGPIGRTLGIELEEVAALTALLGSAGIKGTEAGTALKNSFLRLSAASPKTVKMLKAIGVEVDDGTGNMRKFTDIISDVGSATKDFGTLETAKVFNELFGKRAIAGASNLASSISELRDFEKMLKNAGNTSKLTAEVMRRSLDNRLKSLGSAATEAGFKILDAFQVQGKNGIDALTQSIREFDVKPLVEGLTIILEAVRLIGKVAGFAFDQLVKLGRFGGEAAAKFVMAVTGEIDPTSGFKAEVQKRQLEAANLGVDLSKKGPVAIGPSAGDVSPVFPGLSPDQTQGLQPISTPKEKQQPQRVGPNQPVAAARSEQLSFQGQLNIAGAPEGSTVETKQAPRGFELAMLGAN